MKQEPYRWAQMQARKTARIDRRAEIEKARDATWGSPIHGIPTPFVESFDSAGQATVSRARTDEAGNPLGEAHELPISPHMLNFLLSRKELDDAIATAYQLAKPLEEDNDNVLDTEIKRKAEVEVEEGHRNAVKALERITTLENAGIRDRTHANIRRCVETFGRHNTDKVLRPKPTKVGAPKKEDLRAGPDTGSSEVQIAILTAKIRVLAQAYEGHKGQKDKFNRRNLRMLCHRRQKLLKYMERKERGSERWTNLINTLGLSPATYKEQITI